MKQSVQQVKRKQSSTANKKKSNVTRLRPRVVSQSNHTRQAGDKWERQADEAATRIMQGDEGVARYLTPVIAASKTVPTSHSYTLPNKVKADMEKGFGADLSLVRIHKDAAAAEAAREERARAFTAGVNIYFGDGEFNPDSAEGLQLLMHEVAHVLQQTARPGHEGIYTLRDVKGQGTVQHKFTTFEDFAKFSGQEKLDHMRRLHEANDPKLKAKLDTWLSKFLSDTTTMTKYQIKQTLKNKISQTKDKGELGFILDLSRFLGGDEIAAKIVRKNAWVRTIFPSTRVLIYLLKHYKSKRWWRSSLTGTYAGRLFWPKGFKDSIKEYIWNASPRAGMNKTYPKIKPKKGSSTIGDTRAYEEKNGQNVNKLHYSEWTYASLYALEYMENFLLSKFQILDQTASFIQQDPWGKQKLVRIDNLYKRQMAKVSVLNKDGQNLLAMKNSGSELYWWAYNLLGQLLLDETNAFLKYIKPIQEDVQTHGLMFNKWGTGIAFRKDHPLNVYIKTLPGLPRLLVSAGSKLAASAETFFRLKPEKTRSKRYASVPAKAVTFIDTINGIVNDYTEKAFAKLKQSQTKTGDEKTKAENTAQALFWFAGMLSQYSTKIDLMTNNELANVSADVRIDKIIQYRYERARELKGIAAMLKASDSSWAKLISTGGKVEKGQFIQTSELALQHPFEVDKKANLNLIPKDIGRLPIKGLEPFTTQDLVYFFGTKILQEYNKILRPMVEHNELPLMNPTRTASDLFLLGKADAEMEKRDEVRPHRFVSYGAYWIKNPTQPHTQFAKVLRQHPKYIALAKQEEGKKRHVLHRMTWLKSETNKVVIWSFPIPFELIRSLRDIKLLNAIVYLFISGSKLFDVTKKKDDKGTENIVSVAINQKVIEKAKTVLAKKSNSMNSLSDLDWYSTLSKIKGIRKFLIDSQSPVHADIKEVQKGLKKDYKTSEKDYTDLRRRATNLDREVLGTTDKYSVKNLLSKFDGSIKSYKYLRAALNLLRKFERNIAPKEERELQMSAIILENGPELLDALKDINFYYYASNFFPCISKALAYADKTLAAGNILSGTPAHQIFTKQWGVMNLQALKKNMTDSMVKHQKKFGMYADAGSQTITSFMQKSFSIKAGNPKFDKDDKKIKDSPDGPFPLEGLCIHIIKVLRSFTYYPRLGVEGKHSLHAPTRLYLGGLVDSPSKGGYTQDARKTNEKPIPLVEMALIFNNKPYKFTITTKDLEDNRSGLAWLNHVVTLRSTVKNMENLRDIIQAYGEGLMFILSLTPVGWAVDVAMIIGMVAEFYSNNQDGIKAQLEALIEEPEEMFKKLKEAIDKNLEPEKLLEIFLLGENHYKNLVKVKPKKRPVRGKPGRKRKMTKALKGVRNLGTSLAVQVMDVQGKVQNKASAVRATVVSRPVISAILQWVVDNWSNFSRPEKFILQHRVLGPIYEMIMVLSKISGGANLEFDKNSAKTQANEFTQKIDDVLLNMSQLKLPKVVVPNELLVALLLDAFTDFIARRAPGKVKILTRIINETAEALGAKDALAEALAKKFKGTSLDPNTYWTEYFLPVVERPFNDGLSKLNKDVTRILSEAPILNELNLKSLQQREVEITTSNDLNEAYSGEAAEKLVEETEGKGNKGSQATYSCFPGEYSGQPYRSEPIHGGRPLSKELKQANESRFGHDFSHVRLHTDAAADRRTRSLGANALTSGSHVFLRSGVTPHYGEGARIFRHELSHVLQKTGPRPLLAGSHSASPVIQRGSTALRNNQGEERGADTMAAKANSTGSTSPVPIIGLHNSGVSPNGSVAVKKFIRNVSDVSTVEKQYEDIRSTITSRAKLKKETAGLDKKVRKHANDLWLGVNYNLKNKKNLKYASFWTKRSSQKKALAYIRSAIRSSRTEGSMTNAVAVLAAQNQTTKKLKGKSGNKAKKVKVLDRSSFMKGLELYLLKRTGIPITFQKIKYAPDKMPAVGKRIKNINIGGIQLRWINPLLAPWNDVVKATWKSATKGKRTLYKKTAKNILDNSPPNRNVWDRNEYKFSKTFAKEVEESSKAKKLEAKDLPNWDVFIKTKFRNKAVPGVRLSTHGDFTNNYRLSAMDRQSHHTTQFLLAEYFHNVKTFKPFPKDRNWPASVIKAAGKVSQIKKSHGSNKVIKVKETFTGNRGGKMPAILLSADTHLSAGLHVTPRGDEQNSPTQGYSINSDFDGFMPAKMKQNVDKDEHNEYVKANPGKAEKEIYFAAQKTYKTIRDAMADKLLNKFPESEKNYFARIAGDQLAAKTPTMSGSETTKKAEMKKNLEAIAKAVNTKTTGHNDKTLLPLGWNANDTK